MIISHKHKFIFFCNMKTGTTSIEKVLEPFQEGKEYNFDIKGIYNGKHVPPVIIKACLPQDIWNNYFKFTFVRNPWDRFVSGWKYHLAGQLIQVQFPSLLQHPRGAIKVLKKFNYSFQQIKEMQERKIFSCEDVDYYFNHYKSIFGIPPYSGNHQHHYVFDLDGNQIIDFIGRFEQLEDDFNIIKDKLNLNSDINLPHLNSTKRFNYQKYFTEESKQHLAKLWHKDVNLFGYTFD